MPFDEKMFIPMFLNINRLIVFTEADISLTSATYFQMFY